MQPELNLPPKFAVALDPDFIRNAVARAASLKLPRRTCRPLETLPSRHLEIEVAAFDSEIDAQDLPEDDLIEDAAPEI